VKRVNKTEKKSKGWVGEIANGNGDACNSLVIYGPNKRVHLANGPMAYWAHKRACTSQGAASSLLSFRLVSFSFSFSFQVPHRVVCHKRTTSL